MLRTAGYLLKIEPMTHTRKSRTATVHGELTCGNGDNICIHMYIQLPYTVCRTRWTMWGCTVDGELTCGGGDNIRIHMYIQLPYTVYRAWWTHVWWWWQYTHTYVHTATVHGVPYTVNSRVMVGAIYTCICTYSYRTCCVVHGELCGAYSHVGVHYHGRIYIQLPYTVNSRVVVGDIDVTSIQVGGAPLWTMYICI